MKSKFDRQLGKWQQRKRRLGDRAVGRLDESHVAQGKQIVKYIAPWLEGFYNHGLDFGCGWGRFSKLLAQHCGHLWAVDLFEDWTVRAAETAPTITPVVLNEPKLPLEPRSIDLAVDIMTLQSIPDDALMLMLADELKRVTVPGARVISLHYVKPELTTRTAIHRAKQLGLADWEEIRANDIDKADETYSFLVGIRM